MIHSHTLKRLGLLLCAGAVAMVAAGCAGSGSTSTLAPQQALIQGEVFYLNRIALPADAQLTVSLNDVSLADAPAKVLSRQEINTAGKQVPISFTLTYDPTQVQANHTYSISARIEQQGQLLYINTEHIGVKLDGTDPQPVRVKVDAVSR
ncbi:YbaY family lipoprotein [Saezia sanguinis]|uniref:YbaY family lipoprotein n=1 Tax=Saezia sanguinis TaxID=1965230 RepID=UPI0030232A6F